MKSYIGWFKSNCYLAVFFFTVLNVYSQSKKIVYLDNNHKEIPFLEYSKKTESNLFKEKHFYNESVLYKKLVFKEFFGKIDHQKVSEIYNLYKVDTTKVLYIHFIEAKKDENLKDTISDNRKHEVKKKHELKLLKNIIQNEVDYFGGSEKLTSLYITKNDSLDSHNELNLEQIFLSDYNSIIEKTFSVTPVSLIVIHIDGSYYITNNNDFNNKDVFKVKSFRKLKKKWIRKYKKI